MPKGASPLTDGHLDCLRFSAIIISSATIIYKHTFNYFFTRYFDQRDLADEPS